jgi:hypothetical protein
MIERETGLSPHQRRAVDTLAGAEFDGSDTAGCDWEAVADWLGQDAAFIAEVNRAKTIRRDRLRADVRSLASQAVATFRELVAGSEVPTSVRLRASLAILQAADAIAAEEIGPKSAEGVRAKLAHDAFVESL